MIVKTACETDGSSAALPVTNGVTWLARGHRDDTRRTGNNLNCLKYGYFIKNQDISADRKYVGNIKSLMERFDKYKHIIYILWICLLFTSSSI